MGKIRKASYGERNKVTVFDRFGVYLSSRRMKKELVQKVSHKKRLRLIDLGGGYHMKHSNELQPYFDVTAVDVSLNKKICPEIKKIEGALETVMPDLQTEGFDVVLLNSVLEHVANPQDLLDGCFRILDRQGIFYVNVPTWRGKFFLEYTAFRLRHSQARYEMNDHKMYYSKRELWPMLVKAGFLPENIKLSYCKFGLNLLGICRKDYDYE